MPKRGVYAGHYEVPKRNRVEEENLTRRRGSRPWTKSIIDVERNTFLGITPNDWCRLLIFYLVLYVLLTGTTIAYYYLFRLLLPSNKPFVERRSSGLSIAPIEVTYYEDINPDIVPYVDTIDEFLEKNKYKRSIKNGRFQECNKDAMYGYRSRQPCVFIKLNRVIGFTPRGYEFNQLPNIARQQLLQANSTNQQLDTFGQNVIWLTCKNKKGGAKPTFHFVPEYFWLTKNVMDNMPDMSLISMLNESSPSITPGVYKRIIGVKLMNMPINQKISVHCQIWAKNIEVDKRKHGAGWISFKIKINEEFARRPKANKNT